MTLEGDTALPKLGSYELLAPIAHGGMADIYLARRATPGGSERRVAVKVLNEQRVVDPEARALFLHEARVCALLSHRNIAAVLDADVADGHHFLAMEYVEGVDLRDLLAAAAKAERGVPYAVSIAIVAEAAAGLDHAHRGCDVDGRPLRLVHRDVSLSNIMVCYDGAVKVVDFGIASTTISEVHTMPGVVRGKASYMSPEQCLGDVLDHRTDVFALGVVLYELTTGARCFNGKTDFERMLAVVRNDYLAPSQLVPGYPAALEQVIRTALAPAPEQRFASCAEMIEALEAVLAACGWASGTAAIARLMAELYGSPSATGEAAGPVDATLRQAVLPEVLAESGAIPPHALELAGAPTAPRLALAGAPTRRFARGTGAEALEAKAKAKAQAQAQAQAISRGPWLTDDDDDARTRGRCTLKRRSAPRLAA